MILDSDIDLLTERCSRDFSMAHPSSKLQVAVHDTPTD